MTVFSSLPFCWFGGGHISPGIVRKEVTLSYFRRSPVPHCYVEEKVQECVLRGGNDRWRSTQTKTVRTVLSYVPRKIGERL